MTYRGKPDEEHAPLFSGANTSGEEGRLERARLLEREINARIYNDLNGTRALLDEQEELLESLDAFELKINHLLNRGLLENQIYHYDQALQYFREAIGQLEDLGHATLLAEAYIDCAGVLMNLNRLEDAQELLEKAAKLLSSFPHKGLQGRLTCRKGFLFLHWKNYPRAIELFMSAEKLFKEHDKPLSLKDFSFYALIHSGLGNIYENTNEPRKSIEAYRRLVQLCEKHRLHTRLGWHYHSLGNSLKSIRKFQAAESCFNKTLQLEGKKNSFLRASAYANLGYCYLYKSDGNPKVALELFQHAEKIFKKTAPSDHYNLANLQWWKGQSYARLGKIKQANDHFRLAAQMAAKVHNYHQLAAIYKDMAQFYQSLGDYKKAFECQRRFGDALTKYHHESNNQKILELKVQYESERKEQEAQLFKLQATKLQMKALRAQMNPHFMFNALNSIQSYITSNQAQIAAKYLARFAQLMRRSLEYSDQEIISLEKEIDFLRDYLEINQKLRFADRMKYQITVDEDIEVDIIGVPTLIIQPYVENAIEHGIRNRKDGMVKVHFGLYDDNTILCVVEDNGVGREKARLQQEKDPHHKNHRSMGTEITEKRLEILNTANPKANYVKTIDLKDKVTGEPLGTRVEIKIPIMELKAFGD